jgi:hypothetical protein
MTSNPFGDLGASSSTGSSSSSAAMGGDTAFLESWDIPKKGKPPVVGSSLFAEGFPKAPDFTSVRDWNSFNAVVEANRDRAMEARKRDRALRDAGNFVKPNPLSKYDVEGTQKLATLVGNLNRGVKHRPDWGAYASAQSWLENEQAKAEASGNPEKIAQWAKWHVGRADLDDDKSTPDNVVMFSDRRQGIIKAIDGYQIVPTAQKEASRSYYNNMPDREARTQADPALKKFFKQYYRKNPTPALQAKNPVDEFRPTHTSFQLIQDAVDKHLKTIGVSIKSLKNNPTGTLTAQHYMPIKQKAATAVYHALIRKMYNLPDNFDFKGESEANKRLKSKQVQKDIKTKMLALDATGQTYGAQFFNAPSTIRLVEQTADNVLNEINSKIINPKERIYKENIQAEQNLTTGAIKIVNFNLVDPDLNPVNIENKKRARLAKGYSDKTGFRPKISGKGIQLPMKRIPPRPSLGVGGVDIDADPFAEEADTVPVYPEGRRVRTIGLEDLIKEGEEEEG